MSDTTVPGVWECKTCGFVLFKSWLNATTGVISDNHSQAKEPCPNGCGTLVQATDPNATNTNAHRA